MLVKGGDDAVADQKAYDINQRAAERAHDQKTEFARQLNDAAMRDAQAVIRIVLLLNGGAAIAVLAFGGSLASKTSYPLAQLGGVISNSLWFVFGALSTAFAAAFAYLTNGCYAATWASTAPVWSYPYLEVTKKSKWYERAAWLFHILAVVTIIVGIVLFIVGMFKLRSAMLHLFV